MGIYTAAGLLASYCGMENVNLFTFDVVCALYFHIVLAIDSVKLYKPLKAPIVI